MVISEQFDADGLALYQIPETKLRADDIASIAALPRNVYGLRLDVCQILLLRRTGAEFPGSACATSFADVSNVEIVPCLVSDHEGEFIIEDQELQLVAKASRERNVT